MTSFIGLLYAFEEKAPVGALWIVPREPGELVQFGHRTVEWRVVLHRNLSPYIDAFEHGDQHIQGKFFAFSTHQIADSWLGHTHGLGGGRLRHALVMDVLVRAQHQYIA